MRIVAISDTHNLHNAVKVPDGDVFIFAGDMANQGRPDEIQPALLWMAKLPHETKVIIPGNHDVCVQWEERRWFEFARDLGMFMVSHRGVNIDGMKCFFSGWTPTYGRGWAYMADRGSEKLVTLWDMIPDDIELLVTHGPPKGILDKEEKEGFLCGCDELLARTAKLSKLKYHMFGHIHEHGGREHIENGIAHFNVSHVNRAHKSTNQPTILDI